LALINDDPDRAFPFDGGTYFDGGGRAELASSSDMFEDGPFTVYVDWMPIDNTKDSQEIVGHYNWELVQNKDSITFQVGRMSNQDGPFYSVEYKINEPELFFKIKHSLLANYTPDPNKSKGFIELYIDNKYAGRTELGQSIIWTEYGNKNISVGRSGHGNAQNFKGYIYKIDLSRLSIAPMLKRFIQRVDNDTIRLPISSTVAERLNQLQINVNDK
jgi:hypothetical protein